MPDAGTVSSTVQAWEVALLVTSAMLATASAWGVRIRWRQYRAIDPTGPTADVRRRIVRSHLAIKVGCLLAAVGFGAVAVSRLVLPLPATGWPYLVASSSLLVSVVVLLCAVVWTIAEADAIEELLAVADEISIADAATAKDARAHDARRARALADE